MFEESELAQIRRLLREELAAMGAPSAAVPRTGLVSVTQAAAAASVSERTVRGWLKAGKLHRHGQGRIVLVDETELRRLLATPEAKPEDELTPDEWAAKTMAKQQRKQQQG